MTRLVSSVLHMKIDPFSEVKLNNTKYDHISWHEYLEQRPNLLVVNLQLMLQCPTVVVFSGNDLKIVKEMR